MAPILCFHGPSSYSCVASFPLPLFPLSFHLPSLFIASPFIFPFPSYLLPKTSFLSLPPPPLFPSTFIFYLLLSLSFSPSLSPSLRPSLSSPQPSSASLLHPHSLTFRCCGITRLCLEFILAMSSSDVLRSTSTCDATCLMKGSNSLRRS